MLRNVYYTLNHMKEKGVQPVKVKGIMYTITLNQMKDKRVQPVIAAMHYVGNYPHWKKKGVQQKRGIRYVGNYPQRNEGKGGTISDDGEQLYGHSESVSI